MLGCKGDKFSVVVCIEQGSCVYQKIGSKEESKESVESHTTASVVYFHMFTILAY